MLSAFRVGFAFNVIIVPTPTVAAPMITADSETPKNAATAAITSGAAATNGRRNTIVPCGSILVSGFPPAYKYGFGPGPSALVQLSL